MTQLPSPRPRTRMLSTNRCFCSCSRRRFTFSIWRWSVATPGGRWLCCSPASPSTPGVSQSSFWWSSPPSRLTFLSLGGWSKLRLGIRPFAMAGSGVCANLGVLIYYKYTGFLIEMSTRCILSDCDSKVCVADRRFLHSLRENHLSRRYLSRRHKAGAHIFRFMRSMSFFPQAPRWADHQIS